MRSIFSYLRTNLYTVYLSPIYQAEELSAGKA